ncbi:MAG: hypothetical protein U9R19_05865, partial [Bacteroidota bacterium]|nr:hypothetical protein [Bacteroidota bacterium]
IDFLMKKDEMKESVEDIIILTTFLHHQAKLDGGINLSENGDIPCAKNQWKNFWKKRGIMRF